ncbi:hypothetical protein AGR7B_pAt0074 [Agrobacterium deltaense RV3]|nr:hypothetical protein AGR7B_pAt0074 [Agrobacterium deltaense RV3]
MREIDTLIVKKGGSARGIISLLSGLAASVEDI